MSDISNTKSDTSIYFVKENLTFGLSSKFSYIMTSSLSNREKEVLQLIADEHTAKEIAHKLYISTHTVVSHRKHLQQKMQVRNTAGMVRRGFELGILSSLNQ